MMDNQAFDADNAAATIAVYRKQGSLAAWREIREIVLEMTTFDLKAPDDLRHAGAYIKDGLLKKINARIAKEEE